MIDFVTYVKTEKQDPEFVVYEDQNTEVYEKQAKKLYDEAKTEYDSFTKSEDFTQAKAEAALVVLAGLLSKFHTEEVTNDVSSIVNNAVNGGANSIGGAHILGYADAVKKFQEDIVQSAKHYTDKYFVDIVTPQIEKHIQKTLSKELTAREAYDSLILKTEQHYVNTPYWKLVSNVNTSRSYHYGLLKSASKLTYTYVRYDAVMDNRTSDICIKLNGTEWQITKMVEILERVAGSTDPEAAAIYTPWLRAEEYDVLSPKEMEDAGVIIPPRHGHCRSTLQVY